MSARVLVLCNDLLLGSQIRDAINRSGDEGVFCSNPQALSDALAKGPVALVLADLSPRGASPLPALTELKAGALADVPVVGYFSHVDMATKQQASEAGIDALPRSAFFGDLPGVLARAKR